jgi:hypothetical protein
MKIDLESRKEEVADQISQILPELGQPIVHIGMMRAQAEKAPKLWRGESGTICFNETFATCSDAEIRFAAIFFLLPFPKENLKLWLHVPACLLMLVPFFRHYLFGQKNYVAIWIALFCLAMLSKLTIRDIQTRRAKHLEEVIKLSKDEIAARSYLERVYGQVIPSGFSAYFRRNEAENPIFSYLRYGKDERLKAILKSDLVHPVGRVGDSNPDSREDAPTDQK